MSATEPTPPPLCTARARFVLLLLLMCAPLGAAEAQPAPPPAGPALDPASDTPRAAPSDAPSAAPSPESPPGEAAPVDAPPQEPAAGSAAEGAPDTIVRPRLLRNAEPLYPRSAWDSDREADVSVTLTVDEQGRVIEAELGERAGEGFDEAALAAARKLLFSPATVNGLPVSVQILFTFRFRKPEKSSRAAPPPETSAQPVDERAPATLRVTVFERGKGKRLADVEVYILDQDKVLLTDAKGRFEHQGPPGAYAITIRPPGFYPFMATERVEAGQTLDLKYYVRRNRRNRYSTIVWGSEGRAEVARTSLADDEIRSVAGTMGDPIRVASLLPGASSSVSGLGYPVVRGSLPGDSLYEIDGIRIPMLYHLLFGPAVVHPRFVDEITFQPGGYSAKYGGFPGARIGATTARVEEDPLWVADLSIVETSLFRSQKLGSESEMVAALRYGTLGYIIEGLASNTVFRYWDYQTRIAYRLPNEGKLSLTMLGASDTAGESDPMSGREDVLKIGFHTLDLRYRHGFSSGWFQGGLQLSQEFFEPPGDDGEEEFDNTHMESFRPYAEVGYVEGDLELSAGAEALAQDFGLRIADSRFQPAEDGLSLGLWSAAEWSLGKLVVNPSMRVDHYRYDVPANPLVDAHLITRTSYDPRLSASYDVRKDLRVKGSVAKHTGPTRFSFAEPPIVFGPVPAFEGPGLQYGLQKTRQVQLGVETRPWDDLELNLTGYFSRSDIPVDFSLLNKDLAPDPTACDGNNDTGFRRPFDIKGRSYGAEMLLRRRLGRSVFGWMSYAISRSERDIPDVGTLPFDFDQKHVFNGVVSWEVGRNWTLGGVFHYNTGRPFTPEIIDRCTNGFEPVFEGRRGEPNSERLPNYWRIDVRIQKREVFDTWFFDFYIDFFNAAFQFETIGYETDRFTGERVPSTIPLFVPMIGIRGEF